MARLFIPPLGTKLKLTERWDFTLHNEYRNESLRTALGIGNDDGYHSKKRDPDVLIGLPAGTILTVDRIYIRKGCGDFDSVTFWLDGKKAIKDISKGVGLKGKKRFWAKLQDVNTMLAEVISIPPPQSETGE